MKQWLTCCSRGTLIFLLTTILLLTTSAAWAQATAELSGRFAMRAAPCCRASPSP